MKGFPYRTYPTGWFQVDWSGALASGEVKSLHYFGRDLVLFRGSDGEAHILDAHCPHLGANLGVGGKVEGDCIVCPFHNWRWNGCGENVAIPYGERTSISKRARSWPVLEANGILLMWHDEAGREPDWTFPEFDECADPSVYPTYPHGIASRELRLVPQVVIENTVDMPHLQYVHGSPLPARVISCEDLGPCFRTVFTMDVPEGLDVRTPGGVIEAWGVGLLVFRIGEGDELFTQMTNTTPIDHERAEMFTSAWPKRVDGDTGDEPKDTARARIDITNYQAFEMDGPIWEHMAYVQRPPLVKEEAAPTLAIRRYASKFYPNEPTTDDAIDLERVVAAG